MKLIVDSWNRECHKIEHEKRGAKLAPRFFVPRRPKLNSPKLEREQSTLSIQPPDAAARHHGSRLRDGLFDDAVHGATAILDELPNLVGIVGVFFWSFKIADRAMQSFFIARRRQPLKNEYPYNLLAAFQKSEREDSIQPPAKGSKMLTSISLVVIVTALLTTTLQLPGIAGSVQNAEEPGELEQFVMHLRIVTMLLLLTVPLLCGAHGLSPLRKGTPFRIAWMTLGAASYSLAWFAVIHFRFFLTI